jgi:hypothetical protein
MNSLGQNGLKYHGRMTTSRACTGVHLHHLARNLKVGNDAAPESYPEHKGLFSRIEEQSCPN